LDYTKDFAERRGIAAAIGARGEIEVRAEASQKPPTQTEPLVEPLLRGVTTWARTVAQEVKAGIADDAGVNHLLDHLISRIDAIYERPEAAASAMNLTAAVSGSDVERRAVLVKVTVGLDLDPANFGALRGKTGGMFTAAAEKEKRGIALNNVPALKHEVVNLVRVCGEVEKKLTAAITRERERQRLEIPGLSGQAWATLEKIAAVLERNPFATAEAVTLASADGAVKAELDKLASALERRFGERAFLGGREPGGASFDAAARQVSDGDKPKLAAAWRQLNAVQRLAAAERSEKRVQAQRIERSLDRDGPSMTR
jgi:hypothetical protein